MTKHSKSSKGAYTPEAFPGYKCMSSKRTRSSHGDTGFMNKTRMSSEHGVTKGQGDHVQNKNSFGKAKPHNTLIKTAGKSHKGK